MYQWGTAYSPNKDFVRTYQHQYSYRCYGVSFAIRNDVRNPEPRMSVQTATVTWCVLWGDNTQHRGQHNTHNTQLRWDLNLGWHVNSRTYLLFSLGRKQKQNKREDKTFTLTSQLPQRHHGPLFILKSASPQTSEDYWEPRLHLHCTIEDNGSHIFYRPCLHPIGFGLLQCQSCIQTSSQQQSQNVSYCPHSIYQWTYFDQRYQLHSFAKHCSILAPLPSMFSKLNSFSTILFSIGVA